MVVRGQVIRALKLDPIYLAATVSPCKTGRLSDGPFLKLNEMIILRRRMLELCLFRGGALLLRASPITRGWRSN
jgi:hypothetical protein